MKKPGRICLIVSIVLGLLLIAHGSVIAGQSTALQWKPGVIATTSYGQIRGYESSPDTFGWKGIPYTRPPVGELRWKAPQDPEPWTGIRDSLEFSGQCPQYASEDKIVGDEDCLYMNI